MTDPSEDCSNAEAVENAAHWLINPQNSGMATIPQLKKLFSLTTLQACEACALANRFRSGGKTLEAK